MHELRLFSIIAWIAIPTVMYGGYALLGMLTRIMPAMMLVSYSPAGIEKFFEWVFPRAGDRTSPPPTEEKLARFGALEAVYDLETV